jgi:predicted ATP-binding protein involved in virulence
VIQGALWALSEEAAKFGGPGSSRVVEQSNRIVRIEKNGRVSFEPLSATVHWQFEIKDRRYDRSASVTGRIRGPDTTLPNIGAEEANRLAYPLFACYPADRKWGATLRGSDWQAAMTSQPSRSEAYLHWSDASTKLASLVNWFVREELISLQKKHETPDLKLVKQAMLSAIEGASALQFDIEQGQIYVTFSQGGLRTLNELSAGQKSMLAMIGDLAIRATRLNGIISGDDVLRETSGVVLIDELDLHLHPKWQRKIVHLLKDTFPKLQFIATSHSPQILGELPPEQIFILANGQAGHPAESFGRDTNYILQEVMDAPARNPKTAEALDKIRTLIDEEDYDEARKQIDQLRNEIGPDGDLIQAELLMQRLIILGES